MSMIGEIKFFLGLQIHQSSREIFISKSQYNFEILKKHGMDGCDSINTPMATARIDADLQAYSDADYARCHDDCKSTSGRIQFMETSWSVGRLRNKIIHPCLLRKLRTYLYLQVLLKSTG
ncbi:retrovirus-related pol polyprotein from transposon TNT 1-94 [Tanacetum coccineum]